MGFPERCDAIPPDFNKVDSWQEAVTPCCHCRTFQGDQPLKKKVLKFLSHHDAGLAEQYQCDTLWEICHVPLTSESSKNSSMKTPVQVEEKDVSSVPLQKKNRQALTSPELPSTAATLSTTEVIAKLEAKLLAKYENDLAEQLRVQAKVLATLAVSKSKLEAKLALSEEKRKNAKGRTHDTLLENTALKSENLSLAKKNLNHLAENTALLGEVLEEKQRI
mgnify:CR=1 FL=1